VHEGHRRALETDGQDGEWQKAVDKNFGPAGFKVDSATNPPTPDACS
jgi:glutamate transport system substrate-binding protein